MIDIEKERLAFEIAYSNKLADSAWHEGSVWFDGEWYDCAQDAPIHVQVFCSDINGNFLLWLQCAEVKQLEIEALKAQLEQLKKCKVM